MIRKGVTSLSSAQYTLSIPVIQFSMILPSTPHVFQVIATVIKNEQIYFRSLGFTTSTRVLISPKPDQEGNKLGSMTGTRAISTTSRRELSSSFFSLQGKAPKEIHAILRDTLACLLPGRAKNLSAPLCKTMGDYQLSKRHIVLYLI